MVFAFLLSLYSATAVDVSMVHYTPVNAQQLENNLNNFIGEARDRGLRFYIGVACAQNERETTLQTLCRRQGSQAYGNRCGNESTHHKDADVVNDGCGVRLVQVLYPDYFKTRTEVYAIEQRLIAMYYNNCAVDPLCLNRRGGYTCVNEGGGIVYLRIYG